MNEPLETGSRIYVDANVFIYFIEKLPPWFDKTVSLFETIGERRCSVVTSELTVAECVYRPFKDRNAELIAVYQKFFGSMEAILRIPVDGGIAWLAAELGGAHGCKLIDAVHLASALSAGCKTIVTNDKAIRVPERLRILRLSSI